jgi:hypothetical protein
VGLAKGIYLVPLGDEILYLISFPSSSLGMLPEKLFFAELNLS